MKLSIIVPVYNVQEYIDKCLNSLVNQTLKDIEIIVINDGSTDNSQDIINSYVKKYPEKVKAYFKENGGQGSARNFGLIKAKGEFIGYVDSDDYVSVDMYEKLYNKAIETQSDIAMCGNYVIDENYKIIKNELLNFDVSYHYCLDNPYILFYKFSVCNRIYKRELLIDSNIEFRTKKWYEDMDFTCKLLLNNNNKICFVNEPLYYYLLREGSTMNNKSIERNLEIIDAFDEILKYVDNNKYYSILEYIAITHIYIFTSVRVIKINDNKSKEIIEQLKKYCYNKFPRLEKNIYLQKNKKYKLLLFLIKHNMYFLIRLMFNMKEKI